MSAPTQLETCARLCYQANVPLASCSRHSATSRTQARPCAGPAMTNTTCAPEAPSKFNSTSTVGGGPSHFVSLIYSSLHFMPCDMVEQVSGMAMEAVQHMRKGSLLRCHAMVNSILPGYADAYQQQIPGELDVQAMLSTTLTHLLSSLANLYVAQDKFADALCCAEEALEAYTGTNAGHVASSWFDIGCLRVLAKRPSGDVLCALRIAYETLLDYAKQRQPPAPVLGNPHWAGRHTPNIITALTMLLLAETKTSPVYTKANGGTYVASLLHSLMLYQHKVKHHEDPRDLVYTLRALASFYMTHHSYEVASRYLVEEIRIRQTLKKAPYPGLPFAKDLCADEADDEEEDSMKMDDSETEEDDDDEEEDETATGDNYFDALARLGQCFHQGLKRPDDALNCFQQALDLRVGTVLMAPANTQVTVARVLYNIGAIHTDLAAKSPPETRGYHRKQALDVFELCLGIRKCALGNDDASVGGVLYSMAVLRMDAENHEEALVDLRESLRIRELVAASKKGRSNAIASDRALFDTLRRIGMVRKRQGDVKQALVFYNRAMTCIRRITNNHHNNSSSSPTSADCVFLQSRALVEIGQIQQSLGLIDAAVTNFQDAAMWLRCHRNNDSSTPIATTMCCSRHTPERHAQRRRLLMVEILNGIGYLELERSNSDSANAFFAEAALLSGKNVVGCAAAA